ncbi:MAG TPA: helix-turn-helix domain-containing protein [Candidatus Hydromicrobium sp.]
MNIEKSNKFYTIEEATDMLGISEQEVINMITLKKLPAIKVEKSIKIREEDLEKILDSLGRKITEGKTITVENTGAVPVEEIEDRDRIKEELEDKKIQLERSYRDLLKKKQELEEDINYLQYQYDEFKNRIKNLISDEFKLFLKKIDEENLGEGDKVPQNNFENNLDIDEDIDKTAGNEEDSYDGEEEALLLEDDEEIEKRAVSDRENRIEL